MTTKPPKNAAKVVVRNKGIKKPDSKPREAPPTNVTLRPIDATSEEIAQALFQRPPPKKPKGEKSGEHQKVCPQCGHVFQGNGWDGIDAH